MKSLFKYLSILVFALTLNAQTLVWNPNTEEDLAGYRVYINRSNQLPVMIVTTNAFHPLTNLVSGEQYTLYVTAFNSIGIESAPSEILPYAPVTEKPSTPDLNNYYVRRIDNNRWYISLSWQRSPTNEYVSGYYVKVVQNDVVATNLFTTNTSASVTVPIANSTYVYLFATNKVGISANVPIVTMERPNAPVDVRIVEPVASNSSSSSN